MLFGAKNSASPTDLRYINFTITWTMIIDVQDRNIMILLNITFHLVCFFNIAAAKQLRDCIVQLVLDAFGDQFYSKALQCVYVLREEAIKAGESVMFNTFLQEFKEKIVNKLGHGFWLLMVKKEVTLISQTESPDSNVTDNQAKEFLEVSPVEQKEVPADDVLEDPEDLLEMME